MQNCVDPFIFIAGSLTDDGVDEVIRLVDGLDFPMAYCHSKYHPLFLKRDWNFHLRTKLSFKNSDKVWPLNPSLSIQPIKTMDLFKKCTWYKEQSELYGSDENFLTYGIGYALCQNSCIVSESYINVGNGYGEISIVTHPNHRRKGYGKIIASHIIKACKELQIIPKWSCKVDNRGSLSTALSIGFEVDTYHKI